MREVSCVEVVLIALFVILSEGVVENQENSPELVW